MIPLMKRKLGYVFLSPHLIHRSLCLIQIATPFLKCIPSTLILRPDLILYNARRILFASEEIDRTSDLFQIDSSDETVKDEMIDDKRGIQLTDQLQNGKKRKADNDPRAESPSAYMFVLI
jgi:hypothetical protein